MVRWQKLCLRVNVYKKTSTRKSGAKNTQTCTLRIDYGEKIQAYKCLYTEYANEHASGQIPIPKLKYLREHPLKYFICRD